MSLAPGVKLGSYEIQALLGVGGILDSGFVVSLTLGTRLAGSVLLRSVPLTPPQPIEDGDDACKNGHPAV